MKRGGLGILIILIVALLVAFLLTSQMAGKNSVNRHEEAVQAAQDAVDAINNKLQNSALGDALQNTVTQMGGNG